jgi:endonuclease/exonuclease/phosphatase family metal-dependent hydrolase
MITKRKGLGFFSKLLLGLNIILSAAMLLSYLAPVVNPSNHWVFSFFGLAYPILLLISLLFIVYWLLAKSLWFLLPVIVIAIGWGTLKKNIGLRASVKPGISKDSNAIRIMTYNVHDFKPYGSDNDTSTKNAILDIVNHEQPDIIGFQEFYSRKKGRYDLVDTLKKVLNTNNYDAEYFESNYLEGIGIAIFSKYPILSHRVIWLSDKNNENQCLVIEVKKGNQTFRFYSVHLQSIHFGPEDYDYLKGVSQQGKTDMHSTKRLGSKLKNAFIKRSVQVLKIKADAAQCPYPYIIAGDFNDTPSSFAVNEMSKGLKNAFFEKGSGFGKTYNGDFPNFQIDYIMASPQFDILNYDVVEKRLSDHYPVISDLVLK